MPISNASDTSRDEDLAEVYSTPRTVPTFAWQACQNFLIPRVKASLRKEGETSALVVGNGE